MSVDAARPLLGVAGSWGAAEIALARRFDELHQLIYRRGGLRSSNAAVEEVAKLVLIRLWSRRTGLPVTDHRAAFANALTEPSLLARDPSGARHPIWPLDEPFRLIDAAVLAAADAIVTDILADPVGDPLGTAFDALLAGRYDHTGGLGTYLTPSGVARMMATIAVPLVDVRPDVDGPGYGDPYCGTGRFLVALLNVLREEATPLARRLASAGPFGADVSASSVAKARLNMLLYGESHPLVWTVPDSVTDSTVDALVRRVPLILTNPPFGEGKYDDPDGVAATASVLPRLAGRARIDPSVAGLARSIRLLAPGGVLGIVLPDGVISSPAVEDLLWSREVTVMASVSLPTSTFALSGTVAKTSAVFLRRAAPPNSHRLALARVEHVGYVRQAGRAAPDPAGDQLPAVASLVTKGLVASSGDALVVASEAPLVVIAPADGVRSLDPSRLDPVAMEARQSLLASGGIALSEYLTARPPRHRRRVTTPFVSVLHIDDLGAVDWHAAHEHAPTTPGVLAEPGEIIVSLLNPARLRATVVPPGEPLQISSEFGVFQSTVDPYAVLGLLYSPLVRAQLRPLGSGTSSSRRRITADDVLSLVVPKLAPSTMDNLAESVRNAHRQLTEARARLHQTYTAH
jgi:N-6 DNA Methylase